MGCGMSKSHLMDEGMGVFGSRNHHHTKPKTDPSKLLIKDTSEAAILDQPPALQKINTADDGNAEPLWFGSPSFRVYVQSVPDDADVATSGDERGKEIVIGTQGGKKLICNGEVCVRGILRGRNKQIEEDLERCFRCTKSLSGPAARGLPATQKQLEKGRGPDLTVIHPW